jgi:hypothetical protein
MTGSRGTSMELPRTMINGTAHRMAKGNFIDGCNLENLLEKMLLLFSLGSA